MKRKSQINQYVNNLPSDHELIVVSFYATNVKGISKPEKHWAKTSGGYRLGRTKKDWAQLSQMLIGGAKNKIHKIINEETLECINHNLFNDLHGITINSRGNLLVTATGTDSILEISSVRSIDDRKNYQNTITSTREHTTHVNTSLNYKPGKILSEYNFANNKKKPYGFISTNKEIAKTIFIL